MIHESPTRTVFFPSSRDPKKIYTVQVFETHIECDYPRSSSVAFVGIVETPKKGNSFLYVKP